MSHYIAIIHKDDASDFGISFPDFPGCVSAGKTMAEAVRAGEEALSGHIGLLVEEGEAIPEPSTLDEVLHDPENRDGTPVLVPAPRIEAKTVRVNVTLPEDVLRTIDAFAEAHGQTRSGFLAIAAKRAMVQERLSSNTIVETVRVGRVLEATQLLRNAILHWHPQNAGEEDELTRILRRAPANQPVTGEDLIKIIEMTRAGSSELGANEEIIGVGEDTK